MILDLNEGSPHEVDLVHGPLKNERGAIWRVRRMLFPPWLAVGVVL
jgi:hypothetical protein